MGRDVLKTVTATIGYFVPVKIIVSEEASDDSIREMLCNAADEIIEDLFAAGELEPIIHDCEEYPELAD